MPNHSVTLSTTIAITIIIIMAITIIIIIGKKEKIGKNALSMQNKYNKAHFFRMKISEYFIWFDNLIK